MFIERCLEPARKELDENSPYSFTYEAEKVKSRGRNGEKIVGFTFYPRFKMKNRDEELYKKELAAKVGNITGRFGMLDKNVSDYLLYNLNVPQKSINSNKGSVPAGTEGYPRPRFCTRRNRSEDEGEKGKPRGALSAAPLRERQMAGGGG